MAGSKRLAGPADPDFSIYLEGPRDRDLLRIWALRVSRDLAKAVENHSVLLGGRQPTRAIDCHRRQCREHGTAVRALCILDRDGLPEPVEADGQEPGLQFFTWPRRQIESYLLVPDAILRGLSRPDTSGVIERLLRDLIPDAGDEAAFQDVDAKRLLSEHGPLRAGMDAAISSNLKPGRIARRMRAAELHDDVRGLLARLQTGFRLVEPEFHVIAR